MALRDDEYVRYWKANALTFLRKNLVSFFGIDESRAKWRLFHHIEVVGPSEELPLTDDSLEGGLIEAIEIATREGYTITELTPFLKNSKRWGVREVVCGIRSHNPAHGGKSRDYTLRLEVRE